MQVRAGCLGKLASHGDFIRRAASPELVAFDGWLQAGLLAARARPDWAQVWPVTPPARFLRRTPSGRLLAGVLVASRDSAGRDYPFVVAATLDGREVERRPELAPLLAEPLLDAAEALIDRHWESADHRVVGADVERLVLDLDPRAAEQRLAQLTHATTLEELVAGAGVAWDERGPHQRLLLANAASLLVPTARPRFALALPAADGARAAVWLAILAGLRGDAGRSPSLVTWSRAGIAGGLRLLLVEPAGEHLVPLLLRHLPSDACDLLREGETSAALVQKADARFGALARERGVTAAELPARLLQVR